MSQMIAKCETQSTGFPDVKRVMRGPRVVGMALKLTNGNWRAADQSEMAVTPREFKTLRDLCRWFTENVPL